MVARKRLAQVGIVIGIFLGAGILINYVYETKDYGSGMVVTIVGSIVLALAVAVVGDIQDKIKGE